jgi:hypothetical protein
VEEVGERVAHLRDVRVGVPADHLLHVPRGADAARAAACDEHEGGVGELAEAVLERGPRVLPASLLDHDRAVLDARVTRVHVAGARRDVHERPVAERVRPIVEVEQPTRVRGIVLGIDAIVEPRASFRTRDLVEAAASALEEHDELLRVAAAEPVRILAAACARRRAARANALPTTQRRRCALVFVTAGAARGQEQDDR